MEKITMCRICLARDGPLFLIVNTHLQQMYECLTSTPLVTEDTRPVQVCDLCCARLENCCELRRNCLQSEKLFTQLLRCKAQVNLQMMPSSHYSFGDVVQMTPELLYGDDVKAEALEADDTVVEQGDRTSSWGDSHYVIKEDLDIVDHASEKDPLEEDYAIQTLNSEDCLSVAAVVTEQGDVTVSAHVSKSPQLALKTYEGTSENPKKVVTKNDKREIKRTVEVIPAQKSNETRDKFYSKHKKNKNTSDHSHVHKKISENKVSADQSIKSNASQNLRSYSCDTCQKRFTAKIGLVTHIRTHTLEKLYQCSICNKCFNRKHYLARHILTHTGEKPFQCSICKKYFNRKYHLDRHNLTHTGEKRFQCSICKKYFSQKHHLDTHIRTHTGEKPFQCSFCKKCFNDKSNLKSHCRIHTAYIV